ncbi:MAG: Uma2 family endonuclease [Planctomycetota bacterium]
MLASVGDPPDGTPLSLTEYERLETEYAAELIDGRLSYRPFSDETHQRITGFFLDRLRAFAGKTGSAPLVMFGKFHVRTPRGFRAPDLEALLRHDDSRRRALWWDGADLAAEIVSPDDPDRDLVEKRREYAEAGIPEYWIVDPRPGFQRVAVLSLEDGAYRGEFVGEGGTVASRLLPGFKVPVADCLNPPD